MAVSEWFNFEKEIKNHVLLFCYFTGSNIFAATGLKIEFWRLSNFMRHKEKTAALFQGPTSFMTAKEYFEFEVDNSENTTLRHNRQQLGFGMKI